MEPEFEHCMVCFEEFNNSNHTPLCLTSCGHSLCKLCATDILRRGNGTINCPACRAATQAKTVEELKKNYSVLSLFEVWTSLKSVKEQVCEECEKCAAVVHCVVEDADLCASCNEKLHSSNVQKKHQRVPVLEKPVMVPKCKDHAGKDLDLLCLSCDGLCCFLCKDYGSHQGHNVTLRSKGVELLMKKLEGNTSQLTKKVKTIEDTLKQSNDIQKEIIKSADIAKEQVNQAVSKIIKDLEMQSQSLKKEVDDYLTAFQSSQKSIVASLTDIKAVSDTASRLLTTKDEFLFLSSFKNVNGMVEEVMTKEKGYYINISDMTKGKYINFDASKFNGLGKISTLPIRISQNTVKIYAKLWGAAGASGDNSAVLSGGSGGFTKCEFMLQKGERLSILVGQGGEYGHRVGTTPRFGGGGSGGANSDYNGNSGGGCSFICVGEGIPSEGEAMRRMLAVAGGGGGAASTYGNPNSPGSGGGECGGDAVGKETECGRGGKSTSGGIAGCSGQNGSFLQGGSGYGKESNVGSGGGGGGFYGGGGGGGRSGAGGGGSGFINKAHPGFVQGETISGPKAGPTEKLPPENSDPDYQDGFGKAHLAQMGTGKGRNGGDGRVVIYVDGKRTVFAFTGNLQTLVL